MGTPVTFLCGCVLGQTRAVSKMDKVMKNIHSGEKNI